MAPARCALIVLVACSSPSPKPPAAPPPAQPPPVAAAAPAPDTDGDRIPDAEDQCPNDRETYNGRQDDDGCPDRGCVIVKQFPLCIEERIFFERGKDAPQLAQYAEIVDGTAEAMKETVDDILLVELRGFRGSDEPRSLSKQRASSVAKLLIARGVDAARIAIVDGGVGTPKQAPNGWRRVELSIGQQRRTIDEADEIICTPMGRYFRKLTGDERAARCR